MAVYQDKAKERIKKGLAPASRLIDKAKAANYAEADTRKIVSDMLTELLGWDKFDNVTAEQMIRANFADYVIKNESEDLFVVEVKRVGLKLKDTHLAQARTYAIDSGIDWIILTNGDDWQVYKLVRDGKIPETKHVFSVALSDKTMKLSDKASLLYLLSEEASRKNELDDYYWYRVSLSGENLADHILAEDVINKLRVSLKNSTGQKLDNSEIARALVDRLFRPEKITENHRRAIRKLERSEKQKAKRKAAQPTGETAEPLGASAIDCVALAPSRPL